MQFSHQKENQMKEYKAREPKYSQTPTGTCADSRNYQAMSPSGMEPKFWPCPSLFIALFLFSDHA